MPVLDEVARNWWSLSVRGILAILFGLLMFALPGISLDVLAVFFGIFAFIQGIFSLAVGLTGLTQERPRWSWILAGLAGMAAGMAALFWPALALGALLYLVAAWAVILGVAEVIAAFEIRRRQGEWVLLLSGAVSIIFGLLLAIQPGLGLFALIFLIGTYAVVWGILEIALSVRLRRVAHHLEPF